MDFTKLEEKRKKCATLVGIGIAIVGLGAVLFIAAIGLEAVGFILVFIGMIFLGIGYFNFSKVSKEFKNKYLRELVSNTFDEASYFPDKGVNVNQVYKSDLVKKADRHHTEDLIMGKVDGVSFVTSDVRLEERRVRHTKNGTQVYYVTYFLGRFFEFEFPKEFKSKILVTEGGLFTWFSKYKKIELESVEFNQKFKTYSMNEHDTFYVLTPHLMESIMKLERQNPGSLGLTFDGTRLYILINNNINTFDLKLFKTIDMSVISSLEKDLSVIKEIVQELNLNRKIFN